MAEVTKAEAARLAGVTDQTIHKKVKSGELSETGGKIDTSELIRVFGSISDGTVTPKLQPDAAVQTTLQAKVDGLESQLAVTREQLSDTSKDRDEWRDIAKEATSNVKLITDRRSTPRNNDNIAIFIAGSFAVGLLATAIYFMTLRNDVTADRPLPAPVETQSEALTTYPEAINVFGQPCRENNPMWEELGCPKPVKYGWVHVFDESGEPVLSPFGDQAEEWRLLTEVDHFEGALVVDPVEEALEVPKPNPFPPCPEDNPFCDAVVVDAVTGEFIEYLSESTESVIGKTIRRRNLSDPEPPTD